MKLGRVTLSQLIVPFLIDNYEWSAKEIANNGASRSIYIWAQEELSALVSLQVLLLCIIEYTVY